MKPKEPLLAVLLAFVFTGLGQVYAGELRRGLMFLGIQVGSWVLAFMFCLYLAHPLTTFMPIVFVVFVLLCLASFAFEVFIYIDAYRCAQGFNRLHNLSRKINVGKRILWIVGIVLALILSPEGGLRSLLAGYIRHNYVQPFKIPSHTMEPVLHVGDRIVADKRIYRIQKPQRGDLLVFQFPSDPSQVFVKRVVACEGETVEIRSGGVYINDILLAEPPFNAIRYFNQGIYGKAGQKIQVPPGQYFVLGDNSASSHDSRYWGFVPKDNIIGKAYKIFWPPGRMGAIK